MTMILRSPRQASNIFGLGGMHPPRPKNLFYVKFQRGTDHSTKTVGTLGTPAPWLSDLSFLVKSSERPQIQPVTEEINQYNKKRVVYTGVKYSALRIVFYDTTDNLALQMFSDYADNYFGAFQHGDYPTDYDYDVTISGSSTNLPFADQAATGWGFAPTSAYNTNTDVNSHFYFRKISLYEVWGNNYVQTDIINPRIIAFDPEAMAYEDSQIGTISMSFNYEAVVYVNDGIPKSIGADTDVGAAFKSGGSFYGDTVDYPLDTSSPASNNYTNYSYKNQSQETAPYLLQTVFTFPQQSLEDASLLDASVAVTSGAVATYGDYDFGNDGSAAYALSNAADLLGAIATNSTVAAAINASTSLIQSSPAVSGVTTAVPPTSLSSAVADVTVAAVEALGGDPSGPDTQFYAQQIAAGAMSAAKTSLPREQIFTQNPAVQTGVNSWDSSTPPTNGIALSPATYSALNQSRPASAQIGFNTRTLRSQAG